METIVAIYAVGTLFGLAALYGLFVRHMAWRRMRQTLQEPTGTNCCPACNGTAVTSLGPDYHRCDRCQTAWGAGLVDVKRARQAERMQQLSPAERLAYAIERLDRAEEHFYFAQQWLAGGEGGLISDLLLAPSATHDSVAADLRNDGLVASERECIMGSDHVTQALEALGYSVEGSLVPHIDQTLMWADDFFDSDRIGIRAAHQVWRVRGNVDAALNVVRTLRAKLQQQAAPESRGALTQP